MEWKELSSSKKGALMGFILGLIIAIIGIIGIFQCEWNPIHDSSVSSVLCKSTPFVILFYLPLVPFHFLFLVILFGFFGSEASSFLFGFFSILPGISLVIVTSVVGWLIGKLFWFRK